MAERGVAREWSWEQTFPPLAFPSSLLFSCLDPRSGPPTMLEILLRQAAQSVGRKPAVGACAKHVGFIFISWEPRRAVLTCSGLVRGCRSRLHGGETLCSPGDRLRL